MGFQLPEEGGEVEAPAKAQKAKVIVEAEAAAEKKRVEAEGEAAAIFAKLDAEARGQFEILAKKGDGLKRIIDACGGAQQAFQLMMLEHLDNLAETASKAISNIKFDKVIVWEGGQNGNGTATTNFLQGMARSLPPMMVESTSVPLASSVISAAAVPPRRFGGIEPATSKSPLIVPSYAGLSSAAMRRALPVRRTFIPVTLPRAA